ncbi:MAG: cytochrome c3 family protein [Eubacteriales bacterium]
MKIKLKYLIILTLSIVALAVYIGTGSAADGPSVYVRYINPSGGSVEAHVYWDDTAANGGPYTFKVASDILANGSDADWQPAGGTQYNVGLANQKTKITLTQFKNYYFKVYNGSNVTILRSFPVDFNSSGGPRYQNDYAHGNFTPDTAMCAACHSTHSALKAQLLRQATYYELCMLCHSSSNSQSKYDVETGHVNTSAGWKDSLAGPIKLGAGMATSKHDVNDTGSTATLVPGSDPTPSRVLTFTCVSCHNGHGTKNDNYRLIKKTIYPADNNWDPQTVNFAAYSIVKNISVGEEVYLVSGNTEFCSACHLDYD